MSPEMIECLKTWGFILFLYSLASLPFGMGSLVDVTGVTKIPLWAVPGVIILALSMLVAVGFTLSVFLPIMFVPLWHLVTK